MSAFPEGAFIIAVLLNCPVFLMFCLERGEYHIYLEKFADAMPMPRRCATLKSSTSASKQKAAPKPSGTAGLDVIVVGMSMQEVYALVGQPTATTTHQTGKAWIPFNYGAKDLARTILLYKGQGRVICSHDGYSSTTKVLEVIVDPGETGYP
ncbi:MAG: hypothetical protein ACI9JM_000622 [Halioglobus sp.]